MIIAIREKGKVVVGYTNADYVVYPCEQDYVDAENIPIAFTKNGLIGLAGAGRIADVLLYDPNFLGMKLSPDGILSKGIPYLKSILYSNQLMRNAERWDNAMILTDGARLYDVDPYFGFTETEDYFCHAPNIDVCKSVLDETRGLPATERIFQAMKFIGDTQKINLFPYIVTDTVSRKICAIFGGKRHEPVDCSKEG